MAEIQMSHIRFCYERKGPCFRALDDLSLTVKDGEFVCILGPSGCGKTTLLRLMAGLHLPKMGEVRIGGKPVTGPGTDRSIVFQNYTLFPWMTARGNVQFAVRQIRKTLTRAEARGIADTFLQKVNMGDSADKYPHQMSGGMKQRVAIARALATDTDILLLDEPFGALDAKNRLELQELLETLWANGGGKRKTVVFVTHDIKEAVRLADRILFMRPGRIAAEFPVALPRPRKRLSPEDTARMKALRGELMRLFYRDDEAIA